MKKLVLLLTIPVLALTLMYSCKKSDSSTNVSAAQIQLGQAISDTAKLCGAIKGTMLANKTYTVTCDVTVNAGDTLLIQKGVTVKMTNSSNIIVNGTFISLGTKDAPSFITDPRRTKTTGSSILSSDSAYRGGWGGIYCSATCKLFVLKWTHLDFGGAALQTVPFSGGPAVGDQYVVYYGTPAGDGNFIFEDSWLYGCPDDAVRLYGCHFNIMRNTLEKFGSNGGDGFNPKGGNIGNMAYNMFIGGATNGTKCANDNPISGIETKVAMYNNTYVNGGFRNSGTFGARAGSAEVENQSTGLVYNNIIVNCLTGYRIAGGNNATAKVYHADTVNSSYGYNLMYADSTSLANQFVPTNIAQAEQTIPQHTDIPDMATFLHYPGSYTFGAIYDGSSLVGKNNPLFVNYPLPNYNYKTQASIDGYDFHLQSTSPAIGKGTTTAFSPIMNVPVDPNFGSSGITPPNKDLGCYPTDGTGNQH